MDWSDRPILKHVPNALTLVRLCSVPVFCALIITDSDHHSNAAGALFIAAAITDMIDGQLARRAKIISRFGQAVDPIADRLLVASAVVLLTAYDERVALWMLVLVLIKDTLSAALMAIVKPKVEVVPVNMEGKVATALMMFALTAMLITTQQWPVYILLTGIALSVVALVHYTVSYRSYLRRAH